MDAERIAEIRARVDAATDGPWFQGREDHRYESAHEVYSKREPDEKDSHDIASYVWSAEDAALIAHAPTDIEDLLAEVERLTAALRLAHTLRGDLERIIAQPCPECAMHEHGKAGAERDALAAQVERVQAARDALAALTDDERAEVLR